MLLYPRLVVDPIFVFFTRSLMTVHPQLHLQFKALLPLREYDDLSLIFCDALFWITEKKKVIPEISKKKKNKLRLKRITKNKNK